MTGPAMPRGPVFSPPQAQADQERMRRAHASAAQAFSVTAAGPEAWGWQGRTLGRRADRWWLRLVSAPVGKRGGHLWDGTATADTALPRSVPRPRLHGVTEWTSDGTAYRAELSEYVPLPALQAGGPVLRTEAELPDTWWSDLLSALTTTAAVPTGRQAVRQQWIDRNFTRFLGIPCPETVVWTTGHGDLHWGNLTAAPLVILDWEGWGLVPVGFDAGLLHAYSLHAPATATRIRRTFRHLLDTPDGRVGELVALAQLLQVTARGGHPDLAPCLVRHVEHLTGRTVPHHSPRPEDTNSGG
ncbi:hypothetical protein ACFCYH_00920 [Streptomyces sp. NPDC056400]|uniref:hypothetical protein n=2 Tax=Streptomyces TaxID=1883 RepID=UPI0035E2EEAC